MSREAWRRALAYTKGANKGITKGSVRCRGVGRCGIKTKASQKVWGVEAWAGQVEAGLVGGSDWKDLFLAVVYRHLR